jgi:hypothetical protein
VALERGPLSLVSTTEELPGRNSSGTGLENREYGHRFPLSTKVSTNFVDKRHVYIYIYIYISSGNNQSPNFH